MQFCCAGGVKHPLYSTVLFLSTCGGPLFVANQTLKDGDQEEGWLIQPVENSLAAFRGDLLHGVLPSNSPLDTNESGIRFTLIIGWWGKEAPQKHVRRGETTSIGACMDPADHIDSLSEQTARDRMLISVGEDAEAVHDWSINNDVVSMQKVSPTWTKLAPRPNGSCKGPLVIPTEVNLRFFLQTKTELEEGYAPGVRHHNLDSAGCEGEIPCAKRGEV